MRMMRACEHIVIHPPVPHTSSALVCAFFEVDLVLAFHEGLYLDSCLRRHSTRAFRVYHVDRYDANAC